MTNAMSNPSPHRMVRDMLKLGWTQMQLAHACGVSQANVSRLLTREHDGMDYIAGKRLERLWAKKAKPPKRGLAKRN